MSTYVDCKTSTWCRVTVTNNVRDNSLSISGVDNPADMTALSRAFRMIVDGKYDVWIKLKGGKDEYIKWALMNGKHFLKIGDSSFSSLNDLKHFFIAPYDAGVTDHDTDGFACLQKKEAHTLDGFWKENRKKYFEYLRKKHPGSDDDDRLAPQKMEKDDEKDDPYDSYEDFITHKKNKTPEGRNFYVPVCQHHDYFSLECGPCSLLNALMFYGLVRPDLTREDFEVRHTSIWDRFGQTGLNNILRPIKGLNTFLDNFKKESLGLKDYIRSPDSKRVGNMIDPLVKSLMDFIESNVLNMGEIKDYVKNALKETYEQVGKPNNTYQYLNDDGEIRRLFAMAILKCLIKEKGYENDITLDKKHDSVIRGFDQPDWMFVAKVIGLFKKSDWAKITGADKCTFHIGLIGRKEIKDKYINVAKKFTDNHDAVLFRMPYHWVTIHHIVRTDTGAGDAIEEAKLFVTDNLVEHTEMSKENYKSTDENNHMFIAISTDRKLIDALKRNNEFSPDRTV